jgi:hypothetical protein
MSYVLSLNNREMAAWALLPVERDNSKSSLRGRDKDKSRPEKYHTPRIMAGELTELKQRKRA